MESIANIAQLEEDKNCRLKTYGKLLRRSWPVKSTENGLRFLSRNSSKNSLLKLDFRIDAFDLYTMT